MNKRLTISRKRMLAIWTAGILVLAVSVFSVFAFDGLRLRTPSAGAANSAPAAAAPTSYADVVNRTAPAVVTIRSSRRVREAQQFPFANNPFFERFFGEEGRRLPQERPKQMGLGSGVIITADGYILTNQHVVDGAEEIKVELKDRQTYEAKLVGDDPASDLAVLKVNADNLPTLPLGNSDNARVGDIVLAIGNPLGVGQTVTMGIVSAKGRATGLGDGSFEDFIQTDAPINQGNSGGALIDTQGELIGLNSQIMSPSGGNIGIGFAIPANLARNVMNQLIKGGKVHRGLLGVTVQPLTSDLASSLGLSEVRGALINSVNAGGPAEKAGVKRGDVITAVNDALVNDGNSLRNQIAATQPGSDVTLTLIRDGRELKLTARLAELATAQHEGEMPGGPATQPQGKFGLGVETLTPELAKQFGRKESAGIEGVVVMSVDPDGPAAAAGVRTGDVIQEVNRQSVKSAAELKAALERSGDKPSLALLNRRGANIYLTLRPKQ